MRLTGAVPTQRLLLSDTQSKRLSVQIEPMLEYLKKAMARLRELKVEESDPPFCACRSGSCDREQPEHSGVLGIRKPPPDPRVTIRTVNAVQAMTSLTAASQWCNVVPTDGVDMAERTKTPKSIRTSVSIGAEDYKELERLAEQKKVTVAWMIRDAVEKYLGEQSPLFPRSTR